MSTNLRKKNFLVIFDTCDVVYNWSISLLPPIVFDNLFALNQLEVYPVCKFLVIYSTPVQTRPKKRRRPFILK